MDDNNITISMTKAQAAALSKILRGVQENYYPLKINRDWTEHVVNKLEKELKKNHQKELGMGHGQVFHHMIQDHCDECA